MFLDGLTLSGHIWAMEHRKVGHRVEIQQVVSGPATAICECGEVWK